MTSVGQHLTGTRALRRPHRGLLSLILDNLDLLALGLILLAVAFPAAPPFAGGAASTAYTGFWDYRIFEAGSMVLVALWLVRSLVYPDEGSGFDRPLVTGIVLILGIQAVSLAINYANADFLQLDLERILVPIAAYLLVTRSVNSPGRLRTVIWMISAVLILRALQLILTFGITGTTDFETITGRSALLITEDSLILIFPLIIAWGLLLDGKLGIWAMLATVAFMSAVIAVDFLSLRRGAIIMIGLAIVIRTFSVGRRNLVRGALAVIVLGLLFFSVGPGRSQVHDIKYTLQSAILKSDDSSSDQRSSELKDLAGNMDAQSWISGRGLGVTWTSTSTATTDSASFGSGESQFTRIGWHVYGLDWVYKFGLIGLLIVAAVAFSLGKRARSAYRKSTGVDKSLLFSLCLIAAPLTLMALTNQRIGLMAGISVALVARLSDFQAKKADVETNEATVETNEADVRPEAGRSAPAL